MKPFIVPLLAVLLDQITKWIARQNLAIGESVPVWGDIVRFTHVENTGMAFGLQFGNYSLFTTVSILVAAIIAVYYYRLRHCQWHVRFSFAMILGGALGNLIDRIWAKGVTDFIDVDIPDIVLSSNTIFGVTIPSFHLYRWPVFNVADACVTIGMIGLFYLILFTKEKVL